MDNLSDYANNAAERTQVLSMLNEYLNLGARIHVVIDDKMVGDITEFVEYHLRGEQDDLQPRNL